MKYSLEKAKEVAEKLKKKYKFGKTTCPEWFKNAVAFMEQDGGFNVAICILSGQKIPDDDLSFLLEPFDGFRITTRTITLPTYIKEKNEPAEDKGKKDAKKKKRRSTRKGYR